MKKSELIIFTPTGLDSLDLKAFEKIHSYIVKKPVIFDIKNIIDSLTIINDSDPLELLEIIESSVLDNKRLYLSLDLPVKNLKEIENKSAYIPSWNYKPEGEVLAYYKGSCYTSYDCSSN